MIRLSAVETRPRRDNPGESAHVCRICDAEGPHPAFDAREMMYGSREVFRYFECRSCGTVQIETPPDDLGPYYANGYYSFARKKRDALTAAIKRAEDRLALSGRRWPLVKTDRTLRLIGDLGLSTDARVLDVGCGQGVLLSRMKGAGFDRVEGADPFIDHDRETPEGVPLRKRPVQAVEGTFDLIMFHHSLEHVTDVVGTLAAAVERLAPGGAILVRIPLAGAFAWRAYGTDWYGVDPPRHLVLPTERAMSVLAGRCGLTIERVEYDSNPMQFMASEKWRRDQALKEGPVTDLFDKATRRFLLAEAERLNAARDGDQAAFVLRRA